MIETALIVGFLVFSANLSLFLLFRYQVRREKEAFIKGLRQYFEAQGDKASEFSQLVDIITDKFGSRVAYSLKSTFMGVQSGVSKNTKALQGAMAVDVATSQSPLFANIAASFPGVSKLLQKNPNYLPILQSMLGQLKPTTGNTSQPAENYGTQLALYSK